MCVLDEYEKLQKQMSDIKVPYICYHGDCDKIVPKEGSEMLQDKSCSVDKTLAVSELVYPAIPKGIKCPAKDACLCMGDLQALPAPHFVFLITL